MMKKIRNSVILICALFCWGVAGSLELERLTMLEASFYICISAAICAGALFSEFIFRALKIYLRMRIYSQRRKNTAGNSLKTKASRKTEFSSHKTVKTA